MKKLLIIILLILAGCHEIESTPWDYQSDADSDTDTETETEQQSDCNSPPLRQCAGPTCFEIFQDGELINGECEYPSTIFCCQNGCQNGYCIKECDNPPADHCNSQTEFVQYEKIGKQKNGVCFYGHTVIECDCDLESGCLSEI